MKHLLSGFGFFIAAISAAPKGDDKLVKTMYRRNHYNDATLRKDICLDASTNRIEDMMFQYASLHGLARNKRMKGKIDRAIFTRLGEVFKLPKRLVEAVDVKKDCRRDEAFIDKRYSTFDRDFVELLSGFENVILPNAHLQSWFYFYNCVSDLRQEFVLLDAVMSEAQEVLRGASRIAVSNGDVPADAAPTFVALFVDRIQTDVDYKGQRSWVPTAKFYRKAMDFYEQNFEHVIYVTYSKDIDWSKANIDGGPFIYLESESPDRILAVLGQCNHTILSPGAFGFWSAFLANGEVVYYKDSTEKKDEQHFSYHKMDYYLPYWRPME